VEGFGSNFFHLSFKFINLINILPLTKCWDVCVGRVKRNKSAPVSELRMHLISTTGQGQIVLLLLVEDYRHLHSIEFS
jgi:hypothetical protein